MKGVFAALKNRPLATKVVKFGLWMCALIVLFVGAALLYLHMEDQNYLAFREDGVGINRVLKSFGHAVTDAVKSGNVDGVVAFYASDYSSPGRGRWKLAQPTVVNGVQYSALEKIDSADFDRKAVVAYWRDYLSNISSVQNVECKINLTEAIDAGRSGRVSVKFVLDGVDTSHHVIEDRFFFRWWLRSTGADHGWEIVREELLEDPEIYNVRVAGSARGFEKLDLASAGIDYVHHRDPNLDPNRPGVRLKFAVIEHSSGGVAAVDYDNDGRVNLLFCDGVQVRLYRNLGPQADGQCRFEDVTEKAGLKGIDRATCAVFADISNHGYKDLFIGRYMAPSKLFVNNGDGTFTDRSKQMGLDFVQPVTSACFLDYDRDGYVDLYVTNYGDAINDVPRIPFFARNGLGNHLYHNLKGERFEDVTKKAGVGGSGWSLAVCTGDIKGDGWPDIAVANDFGRKDLYRNNGDGTFTECAKEAGTLDFGGGMGIAMGDITGGGHADIYTSNIYSNQRWLGEEKALFQYVRNTIRSPWFFRDFSEFWDLYFLTEGNWRALGKMAGDGNSLFRSNGDGTFRKMIESCTNRAGWGWGVALFDARNSGKLDIYAANGWISGEKKDDL